MTERDIVKSIAKGAPPDGITAGSLMSSPILSIRKDQPIEEAALLMIRNKVRHLLVKDPAAAAHNEVIGIITTTDLAKYLKKRMEKTVREEEEEDEQQTSSKLRLSDVWELYF